MPSPIKLQDCLWVHGSHATVPLCEPFINELRRRGCRLADVTHGLDKLREQLKSDVHAILLHMPPQETESLHPLFKDRGNFSVLITDWWLSPFWFTRHAEYIFFTLYSGIASRLDDRPFCNNYRPPFFSIPETTGKYHLACAALRPLAALAQPFLDRQKHQLREEDDVNPDRMIYLPFSFLPERLPLKEERPVYDLGNLGDTCGFWRMRDPYSSARYNFVNLYADRKKLADSILQYENNPFKVIDRRRGWLSWDAYCDAVARSKFTMVTGGLQESCVPKYLEHACMGTPMIGTLLPYEYPWLDQCLFPIDAMQLTPRQIKDKFLEALEAQPRLKQNCLRLRDPILKLFAPDTIFDLAQDQINGKPIPPGYVKQDLKVRQPNKSGN